MIRLVNDRRVLRCKRPSVALFRKVFGLRIEKLPRVGISPIVAAVSTQFAHAVEVNTKTIQRDLDYMRYQLDVPIRVRFRAVRLLFRQTCKNVEEQKNKEL